MRRSSLRCRLAPSNAAAAAAGELGCIIDGSQSHVYVRKPAIVFGDLIFGLGLAPTFVYCLSLFDKSQLEHRTSSPLPSLLSRTTHAASFRFPARRLFFACRWRPRNPRGDKAETLRRHCLLAGERGSRFFSSASRLLAAPVADILGGILPPPSLCHSSLMTRKGLPSYRSPSAAAAARTDCGMWALRGSRGATGPPVPISAQELSVHVMVQNITSIPHRAEHLNRFGLACLPATHPCQGGSSARALTAHARPANLGDYVLD